MFSIPDNTAARFLEKLRKLYETMDEAYKAAADAYGFHCAGCADNCCLTRFYHHTHLEYLYLREGFGRFSRDLRRGIRDRALAVRRGTVILEKAGKPIRLMCPLNEEGLCRVYAHRPMICRLHGLAHELRRPGGDATYGPGCDAFSEQTRRMEYKPFDRTPFYMEMAHMEGDLRRAADVTQKIKMTIAEMIETL